MAGERVVVIGGDGAGMSAASQAQRLRPSMRFVAFERGAYTSYSACGLPYYVAGLVRDAESLIARTPEAFASQGIDARVRHEVTAIDLANRRVAVTRLDDGTCFHEPFDHLVIATGAGPAWPDLPGITAEHVYGLATLEDGLRVRAALDALQPRHVVIVGGGYIGLEMAEALVLRRIPTALVHSGPELLGLLDDDMGATVSQAMRAAGIDLYLNERVTGFEVRDGQVAGVVTPARTLPADLVVVSIGVHPNVDLARAAGIPLGPSGAIDVDDHQRTGVENVWAAGDCAEVFHLVRRQKVHVALGTVANKQGRICGINLGGGEARFPGVVGTAITKFLDLEIARTGIQASEAEALGLDYVAGRVDSTSRAGYYPEPGTMRVKILAERGTGRLLGGQILGTQGAGLRVDALAAALHGGLDVETLQYVDLAYAPPFSSVWDPLLIAARRAAEQV